MAWEVALRRGGSMSIPAIQIAQMIFTPCHNTVLWLYIQELRQQNVVVYCCGIVTWSLCKFDISDALTPYYNTVMCPHEQTCNNGDTRGVAGARGGSLGGTKPVIVI